MATTALDTYKNATILENAQPLGVVTYPSADQNPALVYLASLGQGSRRAIRQALDTIADILTAGRCDYVSLPWGELGYQHTQAARAALMERYSPSTVNKHLSALRGVLKAAWRLGYMSAEEYQRAVDVQSVKAERPDQAAGRALHPGEILALINACNNDPSPVGVRDAAIIGLMYSGGLRRAEIAGLALENYNPATNALTVKGKRNKTRIIPLDNGALDALNDWLTLRGWKPGALFWRGYKGGGLGEGEGLTDQAVYGILVKRAGEAGLDNLTPHDLRRTFAGDLLDAGVDLATVSKLMGHSDPQTTAGYDRRGERAKRAAVGKLQLPYRRRFTEAGEELE